MQLLRIFFEKFFETLSEGEEDMTNVLVAWEESSKKLVFNNYFLELF